MTFVRRYELAAGLGLALLAQILCSSCSDSNPVDPDSLPPFVGWVVPSVSSAGDTVFVFDLDTTTIHLSAGDDGGVISNVKVYLDGALVMTFTASPYRAVLSLAGIRANRSARLWATASDPTGKVGSTADTLRFIRDVPPDTARWTLLSPSRSPSAREGFTWELDSGTGRALLFGGYSLASFSGSQELWSFDLVSNSWDSLAPFGTAPLPRTRHGAGLAGSVMVIFGGEHIEGVTDSVLEEYSVLDLTTMTWNSGLFDFALHPTMAMASATLGTNIYFYGGVAAPADPAHDSLLVYSTQSDTWQVLRPSNRLPGDRALALVAANVEDQDLFLYGGSAGGISGAPTGTGNFRLDIGSLTWFSSAAPGPAGLVEGAAVYDSALHRILVWGGRDPAGGRPSEVWEFTLGSNSWRLVPMVGSPPVGRTGHRMIYDAARNRLVLFGGRLASGWSGDTWELAW